MVHKSQRRIGTRYRLKIPIRVQMTDSGKEIEEIREVVNVSGTGA
jgi:hypothetical protein